MAVGEKYLEVLHLLYEVAQSLKGKKLSDVRITDSEKLVLKLFFHASSAYHLSRGTIIDEIAGGVFFYDMASVLVLSRAALEAYLMFFYVFVDSKFPSDQFDFRYYAWQLEGLLWRQDFPSRNTEVIKKLLQEHGEIKQLQAKIQATTEFQSRRKDQKEILKGKKWRPGWAELAHLAGFGPNYAKALYSYLSIYAHSVSMSGIQIQEAVTADDQQSLMDFGFDVIEIVIAKLILNYAQLFPEANQVLQSQTDLRNHIIVLSDAASRLP